MIVEREENDQVPTWFHAVKEKYGQVSHLTGGTLKINGFCCARGKSKALPLLHEVNGRNE